MQESRLFKIVYHLLDKGRATAPELAEKFVVSEQCKNPALAGVSDPLPCLGI